MGRFSELDATRQELEYVTNMRLVNERTIGRPMEEEIYIINNSYGATLLATRDEKEARLFLEGRGEYLFFNKIILK